VVTGRRETRGEITQEGAHRHPHTQASCVGAITDTAAAGSMVLHTVTCSHKEQRASTHRGTGCRWLSVVRWSSGKRCVAGSARKH